MNYELRMANRELREGKRVGAGRKYVGEGRRAFTMIELLIVSAIIPIASLATYGLVSTLNNGRMRTEAHIDASESSAMLRARWQADIEMALRVELAEEGNSISMYRSGEDGKEVQIRYALTGKGRIERAEGNGKPEILCAPATELKFTKIGAGYRAGWKIAFDDGAMQMTWEKRAFGAPLLTGGD